MRENEDEYAIIPHIGSEFLLWLWFHSDSNAGIFNFTQPEEGEDANISDIASVEVYVDDRIAMRIEDSFKVSAVLTGDNPSQYLESKAALAGGKVLQELRVIVRIEDRDYVTTLKGPELLLHGTSLPAYITDGGGSEEIVLERMHLLEELESVLALLFKEFCLLRTSRWSEVFTQICLWIEDKDEEDDE